MAVLWLREIAFIPFVLLGGYLLLIGEDPLFAIFVILMFGALSLLTGYMIRIKFDLARQKEGVEPCEPTLLAIIRKSLAWGFWVGGVVFVGGFVGPLIVTPEANLGPLLGIFLGPVAFVIGSFLAGIGQIRSALTLPKWDKVGYGMFLLLLLIPFALSGLFESGVGIAPLLISAGVYSIPLALFFAVMAIIIWVKNTISY